MGVKGKPKRQKSVQQQLEQKTMTALHIGKSIYRSPLRRALLLIALALVIGRVQAAHAAGLAAAPVIDWSNEARRAIIPAGPGGIFGSENYGNKFPGEAAVYMGIVHAAIYDAAVAIEGGYEPYAIALTASPDATSPAAAIATAAHHTLIGLQPALGLTPAQQAILDDSRADDAGAPLDRSRPPTVERRHAPHRRRPRP